ncbi:hypothetical protein ACWEKT_37210 [Nocardia takedensis]
MDAAGVTRLDAFGVSSARRLEFGHVGHWQGALEGETAGSVAVEIDPGDGSSVVVFVRAPRHRDPRVDFHPDDQVCLVVPELIAELLTPG